MIRCIAIDDEPVALSIIRKYCDQRGNIELEAYSAPRMGMQRIREWTPDVVMLDIEMNGTSGLEMARQLPPSCCLIFTTAYARYALDGFEANAIDFLHKPFFYDRFDRAMQKAEEWIKMHDLLRASSLPNRQLVLKSEYKNVTVLVDTIVYVESMDNYVKVHMTDGSSVLSKMSLRTLESQLPNGEFIRIHRSYVVARQRIEKFTNSEVVLARSGCHLPIGRKYAETVGETLKTGER